MGYGPPIMGGGGSGGPPIMDCEGAAPRAGDCEPTGVAGDCVAACWYCGMGAAYMWW